jgi:anti-sigma28 factor (negative regulator of flagellin synthesis)
VQKDFEKYKIAAKLVLENKPKPIIKEENMYDDVNVEEENRSVRHHRRNENQHSRNTLFNPLSIFNNHFSNMMNEIDNLHRNFGNYNTSNTSNTNMINSYNNTNGYTKSYSRTYVNNNGTGYIKEESIENDGKGEPKVKSFYKKIENGKYVEDPSRSSQKMIEQ